MSGFTAGWLALREPCDTRARSHALARCLRRCAGTGPRQLVDLGAGTGANLRWLAPRLRGDQDWLLVDDDAVLLAALPETLDAWAHAAGHRVRHDAGCIRIEGDSFTARVRTLRLDLAAGLDDLPVRTGAIVTASALLDLVSAGWLAALAARCRAAAAPVLFALTYDGRIELTPSDAGDRDVRDLVNRHQRGDKGFGPALGPGAAAAAAGVLTRLGYRVLTRSSDWIAGPPEADFQRALADGWAEAARELDPPAIGPTAAWHARRLAKIDAGTARVRVGHVDLLALPMGTTPQPARA